MAECPECGRRMRASVLCKHMVTHKKRKTFKKPVDNEAASAARMAKKHAKANPEAAAKAAAKKAEWKNQSTSLRDSIRAAREYQQAVAAGKDLSTLAPAPASAPDPSLVPCPHCNRTFNESAAERHIPKCPKKKK